jgi:preprotein translocase subunit SecG
MLYIAITVLIVVVCILLSLVVLVQNPKGGGLNQSFGGAAQQILGASRSTDIVEKATWTLTIILFVFSLSSAFFIDKKAGSKQSALPKSEVEQRINTAPFTPSELPQPGFPTEGEEAAPAE